MNLSSRSPILTPAIGLIRGISETTRAADAAQIAKRIWQMNAVIRENVDEKLHVIDIAVFKHRSNGSVDQAAGENFFF